MVKYQWLMRFMANGYERGRTRGWRRECRTSAQSVSTVERRYRCNKLFWHQDFLLYTLPLTADNAHYKPPYEPGVDPVVERLAHGRSKFGAGTFEIMDEFPELGGEKQNAADSTAGRKGKEDRTLW